jgi:hypothetical protein
VSGDFILGYKILVMGYWDGLSFYLSIPMKVTGNSGAN